jgi:hypothetical protein
MKTFKVIDVSMQTILILTGLISGINDLLGSGDSWYYFYFVVGSWQVISLIIHLIAFRNLLLHHRRIFYARILLAMAGIGITCVLFFLLSNELGFLIFLYLFGLLWFSPVLAIIYLHICWREYRLIIKRELIHLK